MPRAGPSPGFLASLGSHPLPAKAGRGKFGQAGALLFKSFQVIESTSAWNEASMMFGDTPTVVQLSPVSSFDSISTRVIAPVPPSRIRTR